MSAQTPLFDSHLHLTPEDDASALFAAGRAAGVEGFLIVAADHDDAVAAQQLTAAESGVYATVGLHPHEARHFADDMDRYRELASQPGVVAVGEIGLDYHYEHSPRDVQKRVFREFLALAAGTRLPAVVHCRDAFDDCIGILRECLEPNQVFEVHSFTGTVAQAELLVELGAFLSFNGMVTFKKAENIREALCVVPPARILAETDSPYLAPVPYRGKRNQPAYLPEIVRTIAAELDMTFAEAARATTANAKRFLAVR